jgi:glyoxylase-like metal-dependent hydrolase (beta-lactamase superfamily II)
MRLASIHSVRIHHLNCVSSCPLGGWLMDGRSISLRGKLASRCVLVEGDSGLVLVDTALGLRDIAAPTTRLSPFFRALMAPELREEVTALRQIEALGFRARDVRHIVLTHLDFDHAGGLDDFPEATIHMMRAERDAAMAQRTWLDRQRFRPQQWASHPRWRVYELEAGEPWFGFEAVRQLVGLPPEIVMVPLRGHTLGHAGIAIHDRSAWTLIAGDAYFDRREMHLIPKCRSGLRLYQWLMEVDRPARQRNQVRLRELVATHMGEVVVRCSHDPYELEADVGHTIDPQRFAPARVPAREATTESRV